MKNFWKYAIGAIAVAGLIPYSHKKDKETGASVTQALLWSCSKKPNGDKTDTQVIIGLHLNKMPLPTAEPDEEIVETVEETAEAVEAVAEEAVEAAEDAVEEAVEAAEEVVDDIRETIAEIVEATEAE